MKLQLSVFNIISLIKSAIMQGVSFLPGLSAPFGIWHECRSFASFRVCPEQSLRCGGCCGIRGVKLCASSVLSTFLLFNNPSRDCHTIY